MCFSLYPDPQSKYNLLYSRGKSKKVNHTITFRVFQHNMLIAKLHHYINYRNILLVCGGNGKDQSIPGILMLKYVIHHDHSSTKNQGKFEGMFLILITYQIINLKTIGHVLGLRKCY